MKLAKFCALAGAALLTILLLAACGTSAPATSPKVSYDFRNGAQGWEAGFSDYPPGQEQSYELESGIRDLPTGIEPKGTGYHISGNNHSDDLFMFVKRKLTSAEGIQPNTTYSLTFKIIFASNAPTGCSGIGGAPGESVTLKAGGSDTEPKPEAQGDAYRMNVDKGEQATGGPAGSVAGDIANGQPCDQAAGTEAPYVSLTKEHTSEVPIKSSANGDLWLLVGTDSGFEGTTSIYYQQIEVQLQPK